MEHLNMALKAWEQILQKNDFQNHLIVAKESGKYYAGLIRSVSLEKDGVSFSPKALWILERNIWVKMESFSDWGSYNENLLIPGQSGGFLNVYINSIGYVWLYQGDDPNEGLKLKHLPALEIN